MPAKSLVGIADATKARYHPQERKPLPDWERKELSASRLVKDTAQEYARLLMLRESEPFKDKWGFLGNGIADLAMQDWDAHEVELGAPLVAGWRIVGHPDAITVCEEGVVVGEHKYFLRQNEEKVENAARQATLYLGMAWLAHKTTYGIGGAARFRSAAYHHTEEHFTWPAGALPAGIVVACSPSHQTDESVEAKPVTAAEAEACVAFYSKKGASILASLQAHSAGLEVEVALDVDGGARMWDEGPEGVAETGLRAPGLYHDIPGLEGVGAAAVELREVQLILAEQEARERQLKALIKAAMTKADVKHHRWTDAVAWQIVEVADAQIPAKPASVRKGYSFLKEA